MKGWRWVVSWESVQSNGEEKTIAGIFFSFFSNKWLGKREGENEGAVFV